MPRDPSGNYTLPAGNPVVTGTIIESNWANTTMADLANEMTDSLSRTAEGGMLAPLSLPYSTPSAVGLYFAGDFNTGLYANSSDGFAVSVQGTVYGYFLQSAGVAFREKLYGLLKPYGFTFELSDVDLSSTAQGAIFIGSNDPNSATTAAAHIAMDDHRIQAKGTVPSLPVTLNLNPFGGNVQIGPTETGANSGFVQIGGITAFGAVSLYDDTQLVAETRDSSTGGFFVNNTLTGSGLERVLTASDLSTPQTELIVSGPNPTLSSVDAALALVDTGDDPTTDPHIAQGWSIIQAKSNATSTGAIEINPLGGTVHLGANQLGASGGVALHNDNQTSALTDTGANGGLLVNNLATGAGLERALTTSDITPASVTNYSPARYNYVVNGTPSGFNYIANSVPAATTVTVGRTGSGATYTWTALDALPTNTVMLRLRVLGDVSKTTPSNTTFSMQVYHAGDSVGTITSGNFATLDVRGQTGSSAGDQAAGIDEITVRLENGRFKTRYTLNGTPATTGLQMFLIGFATS